MKLTTAMARAMALLLAASLGAAVALGEPTSPTPSKPPAPDKSEVAPVIEGITIPRASGGFLGLTVEGVCFRLRFYDKDKKPVAPDVAQAAVRWNPANVQAQFRVILNPSADGMSLISPERVRPPLTFRAFFTLLAADGTAVDSFWVTLSDAALAKGD